MEQRYIRHILSSLVVLVALQVQAQKQMNLPRLLVYISVDQLRGDYLEALGDHMGQAGFKRLMAEGRVYPEVSFPLQYINTASSVASLHTGTYPSGHGIESRTVYNAKTHRAQSLYWDEAHHGVYTRQTLSPLALDSETLGDRLKGASGGSSLVYSIAPDAEVALSSAGTLADGCYWIDSQIGSWSSSGYYGSMPVYIDRYNRASDGPNKRLIAGNVRWTPLQSYTASKGGYTSWSKGFSYRYSQQDVVSFKRSPLINEEVTDLALKVIESGGYEHRSTPGLLSLSYTLAPYTTGELTLEDADAYVRLDAQLARLFQALESKFGLQNCLIALTGTGYTTYQPYTQPATRPARRLSLKRSLALLNMYLVATYGSGDWIEGAYNGRVYLNAKLIESKKLTGKEVRSHAADFLAQVQGIARVTTSDQLLTAGDAGVLGRLRRSVNLAKLSDLYLEVMPNWQIEEAEEHPDLSPRSTAIASPYMLMRVGVSASQFDYPVAEARDIVRQLSQVLRIRPPNGMD